jgi:dTDP-4-amino-4,6-dideoxygalactose transaminase
MILGASPCFPEDSLNKILDDIRQVLKSGRLTDGPNAEEFENKFANYLKVKHAIAVNSGTAALEIALRFYKLSGREVIVPTNTFVSTPNTVIFAGGRPVFADMKADTLCIDVEEVKRKLSPKTAGVIVVHIAGLICPQIKELQEFCREKDLFLMEDAAHAHGGMFNGQMTGSLSDVGCFSFYPTKVMTSCEGGMITTDNDELASQSRCLRTIGQNHQRQAVMLGHNWRLNEMSAVVGKHQLEYLEKFVTKRNKVAKWYNEALSGMQNISLFQTPPNIRNAYYKYPVKLADGINREKLSILLKEKFGVETGHVYYPPCHLQPFYMEKFGTGFGDMPVAERVLNQVLCLPIHYEITKENVDYTHECLAASISELQG